jgi:NAD(P)-dependent dehydrogenase (short-subunit alcohol dehydrogenase family)
MRIALRDKRVLIAGGSGGIGRAIGSAFLKTGARVHIAGHDPASVERARAELGGVTGSAADVSRADEARRLIDETDAALGGLDILINSAGVPGPAAPIEEISLAEWQHTLDVDITGTFLVTSAAVPLIKGAGSGSIVSISSVAGRLGYTRRTPYAAAKWAVAGFTKSISMELGPFDINVNCILPGPVAGELQDLVLERIAEAKGITPEDARAERLQYISMRRMVTRAEVADLTVYLCSPQGHGISGQTVSVDGDQTALV